MFPIWSKNALDNISDGNETNLTIPNSAYLVKWDQNNTSNPQNWSDKYKWWVTFQLGMLALAGSLGSSITTPADNIIAEYVGVSDEVAVLDVSLYL